MFEIGTLPAHAEKLKHLEIDGTIAVGNNVVLVGFVRDVDAVEALRKDVDRGGAVEQEVLGAEAAPQHLVLAIEQDKYVELGSRGPPNRRTETVQRKKEKPFREGKILIEQPVALEGAWADWQQRLVLEQTQLPDRRFRQTRLPRHRSCRRPDGEPQRVGENLLEDIRRRVQSRSADKEDKTLHRERGE